MSLYDNFDFELLNSPDFKEDAVREELINPILKELGYKAYGHNRIIYSKTLSHPFVKIGSQKRPINIVPDYLLEVDGRYSWVLDAKAPTENILSGEHIEQVYSYAIHPDINVQIFALCNGREFVAFDRDRKEPLLYFPLSEFDKHWEVMENLLSPDRFTEKKINIEKSLTNKYEHFSYVDLPLPKPLLKVRKRATKRHFGVHGYFTKQSWDVVQQYIKHFTKPNDVILDPFGGSGVTAIEAIMLGRKGINIDINPLAIFLVSALTCPVNFDNLLEEYSYLMDKFKKKYPVTDDEIQKAKKRYSYPITEINMKGADVSTVDALFSDKQLAQLGLLKYLIKQIKDESIRKTFLLMFSGLLTKANLTYHTSTYVKKEGGGNASAFQYYRYRIAKDPVDIDILTYFELRFKKIFDAKKEIAPLINESTINNLQIIKGSATHLSTIEDLSIDYIYTDPPYGDKIPYLDLSVMWNAWLDLPITEEDRKEEAIEGGSLHKTKDEYSDLLSQSIKEMYRVLKFDRWLSFVFSHKDPHYWHIIVEAAEKCGFEYVGTVKQSNGQTSFKKRQNPFSVLSGQLIINFIKKETPKAIQKFKLGNDIYDLVIETIESVIAANDGANLEQINDELIIKGLQFGFLHILSKEYKDLTPLLKAEFDYEPSTKKFYIRKNQKFKTKIPLDLRIKYFLISYLKEKESHKEYPSTDDIILDIIPLLKNGITPEKQTIINVLITVAEEYETNKWRLKQTGQLSFNF
ncbi:MULTISPECIES: DNA methyltransferase [unclassified Capnocytophaga]|uniref:DNA methyltransferase n=1 Tax=unclassified Capnocytophaga TaxID=2640652 RepID=UPI000202F4EB|nr:MULTISPECIES: DNA methyltransferase [unclassified Capnocytophaga]EGD33642.1 type I restriction enzyme R protein [Capnocytophaga sp. oral taxon 338 str. F0234]MEB3004470.1 DNA methyltransferase [Capnocytophaga sp. G2]